MRCRNLKQEMRYKKQNWDMFNKWSRINVDFGVALNKWSFKPSVIAEGLLADQSIPSSNVPSKLTELVSAQSSVLSRLKN